MKIIHKYFKNLTEIQIEQFEKLQELYQDWNLKINVVSRKDIDELYLRHVLHSLAIAKTMKFKQNTRVLDVGTSFLSYWAVIPGQYEIIELSTNRLAVRGTSEPFNGDEGLCLIDALKDIIGTMGVTEFAKLCDMERSAVSRFLSQNTTPKVDTLNRMLSPFKFKVKLELEEVA